MKRPYPFPAQANLEPAISELLNDPTMHLVLARDGLNTSDLKAVIQQWRHIHCKRPEALVAV